MKTTLAIKIAVSAAICLATLSAAPAFAADLTVNLQGLRAQTGLVKVALVDSQQAWDGKAAPVQATGAPPQGEVAQFTFKDLKPGRYAVMITHDENGNGKMDMMLMPKEGFGFSRNPKIRFGPPKFADAAFVLAAGENRLAIKLSYFL